MLNPAIPPIYANGPRKLLVIGLAVIMGGILGLCFAFVAEILDRRVRCLDDIAGLLEVPVFAIIDSKRKKSMFALLPGQSQKLLRSA